jgi:ABC-type transport system involved in multi-copper enzyme maturation permease subunit
MRGVIWAIWADTWRQSRQQMVYLLLAFALLAVALGSVFLVTVRLNSEGQPMLTLRLQDQPAAGLETSWDRQYRQAVAGERIDAALRLPGEDMRRTRGELSRLQREMTRVRIGAASAAEQESLARRFDEARGRAQKAAEDYSRLENGLAAEAQVLVDRRAPGISALAKGVDVWTSRVTVLLFWIIMLGFLSAAAGYFPGMMKAGAIDLMVSKPLSRFQLFMGKYLGGLGLCTAALLGSELVLLVGLGILTGIWPWGLLSAFPVTLFSAALLFAVVVLIGVATRSTALSMLGGYAYYLVVDTAVWGIQSLDAAGLGIKWLQKAAQISRWAFPGFSRLRTAASAAVLHIPIFDWQPVLVALVWLIALLAAAYALFRRIDF